MDRSGGYFFGLRDCVGVGGVMVVFVAVVVDESGLDWIRVGGLEPGKGGDMVICST